MSDRRRFRAATASWQLAQTLWVGGLWLLHFVVVPSLERVGLAPLLVEEITRSLTPLLVAFTAFCALVQGFVLVQIEGVRSLQRDSRGQLLVAVLVMAVVFLLVNQLQPSAMRWLAFNYLVLAFCGALLVIQPVPVGDKVRAR
ncbi:DUF4149 domain-containing protein [Pseudomonas tohonis]|uniref:DUF4149 domain-containing protein n=1 Tax=Pseudomonas tohonis TaxID=2725477 RepID=UPI0021D92C91|nr:DUF4149 domain-containing protein [Pseudomonas tohonis]UXY55956.1 DUF4149 domain-containing protein [Pseudomonas tohonis]